MRDVTWQLIADFMKELPRADEPVATEVHIGAGVIDALKASGRYSDGVQPQTLFAIPLIERRDFAPGLWIVVDQHGKSMAGGSLYNRQPPGPASATE